jgi:hypothetical protein
VFHQRLDRAFGCGIGGQRAGGGAGHERGGEYDIAALAQRGQQLLHQEEWCPDIDGKEIVEILDLHVLDLRRLRDAGVGDQDVEPIADDGADLLGQSVRAVRLSKVGADLVSFAAGLADLGNDGVGFLLTAAEVDQHLRAFLRQSQGAGPADAARSAGNESGFS